MALVDKNIPAALRKGKNATSGRMAVRYIDSNRRSRMAIVLGPGTTSGLKLAVEPGGRIVDNVPLSTTRTSTNSYEVRI